MNHIVVQYILFFLRAYDGNEQVRLHFYNPSWKDFFRAVSKLSRDAMHDVLNMVFAIYDAERPGFRSLNVLIFKVLLLKVMSKRFNENDGAIWATFTIIFWGTSWLTTIFWKLEGFKTVDNASTANYRLSSFRPLNSINWIQINYCFQKANIWSELRKHETLESLSNTMTLLTFVNKFRTLNREWE